MKNRQFPNRLVSNVGDSLSSWLEKERESTGETESAQIRRVLLEYKHAKEGDPA